MFGNWLKTSILMAAIVALFGVVGGMLGARRACSWRCCSAGP